MSIKMPSFVPFLGKVLVYPLDLFIGWVTTLGMGDRVPAYPTSWLGRDRSIARR